MLDHLHGHGAVVEAVSLACMRLRINTIHDFLGWVQLRLRRAPDTPFV